MRLDELALLEPEEQERFGLVPVAEPREAGQPAAEGEGDADAAAAGTSAEEFGVMSNTTPGMNLKEVLCRVYTTQAQFIASVWHRAARLVKQNRDDLTEEQDSLPEEVACGERQVTGTPQDAAVRDLIRPKLGSAEEEIQEREALRIGQPYYKPVAWGDIASAR